MFKRGRSYYVRVRENYGDRWVCLGSDREEARKRHRALKSDWRPVSRLTVEEAANQWLGTYVPTKRNEKGIELAKRRVAMYLVPFFKYRRLAAVTPDELRRYRLHLETKTISKQTVAHLLS